MIMKRPSMRSAKMPASAAVARNSGALMREEVTEAFDIEGEPEICRGSCLGFAESDGIHARR